MGSTCSRPDEFLRLDPHPFVPGRGGTLELSLGRTRTLISLWRSPGRRPRSPKVFATLVLGARRQNEYLLSTWNGEGFMNCNEDEAMELVTRALRSHGYPEDLAEGIIASAKHKNSEGTFSSPYVSPNPSPTTRKTSPGLRDMRHN